MAETPLLDRIQLLIAAPPAAGGGPTVERLEDVLTEGYAVALALEAERWRLERRLGELAEKGSSSADELSEIARKMAAADGSLIRLRAALSTLRDRARAARAA
jgi:hypothetical protein